jgi:predicted NAD/FAD-dependent oxidoreductase
MTDFRQELAKAAEVVAGLAREASYVVIGAGVLGLHKAQVHRHELTEAALRARQSGQTVGGREQMTRRAKELDAGVAQVIKVIDSTLEPVFQRLPDPVQAVVQQAREARDELRTRVFGTGA